MNGSNKSNKVEKFLNANPQFLAGYLEKRMQAAVTNYLEHNPQFLNDFLLERYEDGNENSMVFSNYVPSNELPFLGRQEDTRKADSVKSLTNHQHWPTSLPLDGQLTSSSGGPDHAADLKGLTSGKETGLKFNLHGQQGGELKENAAFSDITNCESESDLLLELARELVTSDEPDRYCFLALRNLAHLLSAEKCSLFWIRDTAKGDSKELASRLWNVTSSATFDNVVCDAKQEMVLTIDRGIIGMAARTKEPVNVANAYEHEHFDKSIDEKTGFETRDLLCYPLILATEEGKVAGVVEVLNKKTKEPFTEEDMKILANAMVFCCLAIQKYRDANQIKRLQQAATLQNSLSDKVANLWKGRSYDDILKSVVLQISELVQCERYTLAVALVDNCNIEGCLPFARSYDMLLQKPKSSLFGDSEEVEKKVDVVKLKKNDWIFTHKVIEKVIETKQVVNMSKITPFSEFKLEDAKKEFSLKTVLCVPYYDAADRLLGVLFLSNKKNCFNENDEATIESIQPFIMNGLLFGNAFNSIVIHKAKTDVADDIVRFHTRAFEEEVERVINEPIPEGEKYNLYEFAFSDLPMSHDETVLAAMRMFEDLDAFNLFKIKKDTMLQWIISVRRCYRPVSYHNWRHGFNVAHTMFLLIDRLSKATMTPGISSTFSDREKFTLVVAGFCHDIDHRGTNNAFLIRAAAPLAILYNTSTLENHHYDTCLRISSMPGNNVFESFTKEEFEASCELMKHAILATDLALYFQRRNTFKAILSKPAEERDFTGENRMLLMAMMMTASDLSSITKPWEVQQKMAKLVTAEFFDQGDQERKLFGTEPMPMMDRKKEGELPKMQIGFIDGVCSMAYEMMADFCPEYSPLRDGMRANRQRWKERWIELGMPDPDAPKVKKDEKEVDIGDIWEKYWNNDPENYIWGIDPNEAPPEVVIEKVVFSPKKKAPKTTESEINDAKSKKKKKKKDSTDDVSTHSKGQSKTCVVM